MDDGVKIEQIARALVVPLGYPANADWERIFVGNQMDTAETGSLAHLCRELARVALRKVYELDNIERWEGWDGTAGRAERME